MMSAPLASKCRVLRVMTRSPCRSAVAAMKPVNARNDDSRLLGTCRELAPEPGRLDVDRENPVAELGFKPGEPRCEGLLLPAGGKKSDALGDLAHGENAEVEDPRRGSPQRPT